MSHYTDRFWQKLLLLRMMEHVPEETLQIKYEDGLQRGIQAKLHSLQPTSLFEAISYAHDAEKEINASTRMIQENQHHPQQNNFNCQPNLFNNNKRYNLQSYNTPHTNNFTPPHNFNAPRNTPSIRTNLNPHRPPHIQETFNHTPPPQDTHTTTPCAPNHSCIICHNFTFLVT